MKANLGFILVTLFLAAQALTASGHPKTKSVKEDESLIGMHYEPWFTPHNISWKYAEATPILGKYSSYDVAVIRKHEAWFEDLGIDWLMVDWSNMLWLKPSWESQRGGVRELEQTTKLLLDTYAELQKNGRHPPKIVLLLALQNGLPVANSVQRLNKVIGWINTHYLADSRYENLWLKVDGKPLLAIWYSPYDACKKLLELLEEHHLAAGNWTVRYVNQQLQISHTQACGMWSWIDGTIRQQVTYRNGKPEHVVVTDACFPPEGWLSPKATAKDNGMPYLESWKMAFETRPEFISLNQWNGFTGERKGHGYGPEHHIYLDEYSAQLSDDLEPTKLGVCGYRGCDGWGYYYFNLTKALISLYRRKTPGITVLALSKTSQKNANTKQIFLQWMEIGKPPVNYSLELDGKTVATHLTGDSYTMDIAGIPPGKHHIKLVAHGVSTYFDLDPKQMTRKSQTPLEVSSSLEFTAPPAP